MTADDFISTLRDRRNYLEYRLRKVNTLDQKQDLLWKIEKLNIFIQEFGQKEEEEAYQRKKAKGKKF